MQGLDGKYVKTAEWSRLIESIPSSYTVWKDGSQAIAECNMKGGTDITTGTDAEVIQAALDGLTSGRTWKEKVVLNGDFNVSTRLELESNTILDGPARLLWTGAGGVVETGILHDKTHTGWEENIGIHNLTLDGNDLRFGVHFESVKRSRISGDIIVNSSAGASSAGILWGWAREGCIIDRNIITASACSSIYLTSSTAAGGENLGTIISNNYLESSGSALIVLEGLSTHQRLQGVHVLNNRGIGQSTTTNGIRVNDCRNVLLSSNNISYTQHGIFSDLSKDIKIKANTFEYCYKNGMLLDTGGLRFTIEENTCKNNNQQGATHQDGINMDIQNSIVMGNICYDDQTPKTQEYGIEEVGAADYNIISRNNCSGNLTGAYLLMGSHNTYDGKAESPTPADLSGAAETHYLLHSEAALHLASATLLYTEASSGDAGVTVEIGKETDRNYYYTGTTEVSKSQWYTKTVTLLKNDIAAGDTVTFYSPGGKTGTGEIVCIIEYLVGA